MIQLDLHVAPAAWPLFIPLLEKGVVVSAQTGCSVRDFLCTQLGLADAYLDQRIQTLFLNARPIDDVDAAVVEDGSTLALSAAMPGLVGATMRKGGRYAALRKDISQPDAAGGTCRASGKVTVKLFNMVAEEIGARLLAAGVEIDGSDLGRIAARHPAAFSEAIQRAVLDAREFPPERARFAELSGRRLLLRVTAAR